jgi:hypothetical protein
MKGSKMKGYYLFDYVPNKIVYLTGKKDENGYHEFYAFFKILPDTEIKAYRHANKNARDFKPFKFEVPEIIKELTEKILIKECKE